MGVVDAGGVLRGDEAADDEDIVVVVAVVVVMTGGVRALGEPGSWGWLVAIIVFRDLSRSGLTRTLRNDEVLPLSERGLSLDGNDCRVSNGLAVSGAFWVGIILENPPRDSCKSFERRLHESVARGKRDSI